MCKCEICGREFVDYGYLQNHLRSCHKMDIFQIEEYYKKYYKTDGEGIDPITGNPTEFISIKRGYKKFEANNPQKFSTNTIEHHMRNGLSYEDAKKRVDYVNKKSSEYLTKEWKNIKECGKTRGGWSKKHFIELGFSDEDADKEVKKRAAQREEKMAKHRENARRTGEYKLYKPTCIEYYLNKGMSESEANDALKKRQATNTVETYIKKYGELDGLIKFKERNKKWSLEMEEKYQNGEYNRDSNKNGNGICNRNYSTSEKELSVKLFDILNSKIDNFKYMSITTGNCKQYYIFDSGRYCFYDITFEWNGRKRIIEFNGDYWHMNPDIYNSDDYNTSLNLYAKDIWKKFDEKKEIAKNRGFEVYVVWEKDWNANKENIIDKCINFLLYD